MVNVYQELINYEGNDWDNFLDNLDLLRTFSPVLSLTTDADEIRGIVRYIAHVYSHNSDKSLFGRDFYKNKKKIFDDTMLSQQWLPILVDLSNEKVVDAISNWIEYQDDDVFQQLIMLKELMSEMRKSCVTKLKKGKDDNGGVDYDQKFKNAEYAISLRKMIKELESELMQNDPKFKKAFAELKESKSKNFAGIEKFAI